MIDDLHQRNRTKKMRLNGYFQTLVIIYNTGACGTEFWVTNIFLEKPPKFTVNFLLQKGYIIYSKFNGFWKLHSNRLI